MAGSTYSFRIQAEGFQQVAADLQKLGQSGEAGAAALEKLKNASPQLAVALNRAEEAAGKQAVALTGLRNEAALLTGVTDGLSRSMGGFGAALTSPVAAVAAFTAAASAGVASIAKFGDEFTSTMNRLQAATGSIGAARDVYAQLVALSQQTGAAISESAGAFARFSVAARDIGATNTQIIQLTRTIQQAGLVAGSTTQETTAATQQLGQALASGKLQGDELRSLLENMPTLAEAIARQLGVGVGQLRQMGTEGKLTSDQVFQAILRASEQINQQFDSLTPTMGRAFGQLGQSMVAFVGQLDQALGLSQRIAQAATAAAGAINAARGSVTPRTAGEQAAFDESSAVSRRGELDAELARLASGDPVATRRGSLSRSLQDAAASANGSAAERQSALRQQIAEQEAIIAEARERRAVAARQDDEARQGEEATSNSRRLTAARTAQTTAFHETRDGLDRERKLREDHSARILAIDNGLAAGATDQADAARLRDLANRALADGLKGLSENGRQAAQDLRDVYDVLRRDAGTGLLSMSPSDDRAFGIISAQTRDFVRNRDRAERDAARDSERAAQQLEQENRDTTNSIVRYSADRFADLFATNSRGWEGMLDNFKRTALSTFTRIGVEAIIRPIIAPIVSQNGLGGTNGLTNLLGITSSGDPTTAAATSGGGGIFSSLGLSGIGSSVSGALGTTLWTTEAGAQAIAPLAAGVQGPVLSSASLGAAGMGTSLGSLLGGTPLGFGAGMLTNRLAGGNSLGGTVGSGVGSLAGAAIGSIIPGVGTLIGGMIGGAAGGGLGGLFGPKKSFSGGDVMYGINAAGQLDAIGAFGKKFDMAGATAEVRGQLAPINAQLGSYGIRFDTSQNGALGYQIGNAGFGQSKNGAVDQSAIVSAFQKLGISDNANVQTAIRRTNRSAGEMTVQSVLDDAGFVKNTYEALLKNFREPMSDFAASVAATVGPFDDAIKNAEKLGLATDELTQAREKEFAKIVEQRNQALTGIVDNLALRRMRAAGGDAQGADNFAFDMQARQELTDLKRQLEGLGTTATETASFLADLERTQGEERLAIAKKYGDASVAVEKQRVDSLLQQGQSIRDFIDAQNATGASGAAPLDQLAASRDIYSRDLALARGNDSAALGRITGQASTLLSAASGVYASGADFQTIRGGILSDLAALPATLGQDATTAARLGQPTDALTAALLGSGGAASGGSLLGDLSGGITQMVARMDQWLTGSLRMESIMSRGFDALSTRLERVAQAAEALLAPATSQVDELRGMRTETRMAELARRVQTVAEPPTSYSYG